MSSRLERKVHGEFSVRVAKGYGEQGFVLVRVDAQAGIDGVAVVEREGYGAGAKAPAMGREHEVLGSHADVHIP